MYLRLILLTLLSFGDIIYILELIELYHKLSIEETLNSLDVNPEDGLSYEEAAFRGEKISQKSENSSFFKFARVGLSRPSVWLLLVAAALVAVLDGILPSLLILAVIVINVVFSAEGKRRGLKAIENSVRPTVTHAVVLRSGAKMRLLSDELVVGDIVTLKPGRIVPADLRLISADGLVIDESSLTGLSEVSKDANATVPGDVPPERRVNCAFEGTIVLRGRGDGVVISTGMSTEMSRLARGIDTPERDAAPVLARIKKISEKLTVAVSLICVFIFIAGLLFDNGLLESAAACIALAVAAIPEGLYIAALTSLSKGARRLTASGFCIKSIEAVESLGEVSAYITDIPKLGVSATYTNGRRKAPHEEDTAPFIDGLLLCELENPSLSAYASHRCDAEEIRAAFPKIGELSGEVTTTLHRAGRTTVSYTGGDAFEILERSERIWEFGKIRTLTESDREEIRACISSFEAEGFSSTAIGMRSGDELPCDTSLVFLGIAATSAESDAATTPDTEALKELNIPVYLVTSADANRARLGAEALSIPSENILCGRDIERMSETSLCKVLSDTFVFAGLAPRDKVRIALALKSLGRTVCAIGSSLSDTALLDSADVGLSDIRAEDAAKSASDVLYNGDSGADRAIILGSITRENLSRAVTYLIAANLSEVICVGLSVASGFGYPMTPFQILFVNLITDIFPAMLLANSSRRRGRCSSRTLYIIGGIFGILSTVAFLVCSSISSLREFAGIICAATLTVLELLLVIPAHLLGGTKNAK